MTAPTPTLDELEAAYSRLLDRLEDRAADYTDGPPTDLMLALRLVYREIVAAATAETVAARKTGPDDNGSPEVGSGVTAASKHLAPVAPPALAAGWSEAELSESWGYGS